MKPAPFEYAAPASVDEALALLAEEEARPLAGGQSLVPLLNMRFARPTLLVDLDRVAGLDTVEHVNGAVRIGAMVRQRTLETDSRIGERLPLLADAVGHVAHVAIRTRGTVGGSLAHADPAAELPPAALALGARFVVRGSAGPRIVPASEFFLGPFTTAVGAGELLEAVELDAPPAGTGWAFLETARVHGAFALVGVAALLGLGPGGEMVSARLALCGVGGSPYEPEWLDDVLLGERADERTFRAVADRVAGSIDPHGDGHAGSEHRRRLAAVLTRRALVLAAGRART